MNFDRARAEFRDWLAFLVTVGGGALLFAGDPLIVPLVASMMTVVLSFYFGASQKDRVTPLA